MLNCRHNMLLSAAPRSNGLSNSGSNAPSNPESTGRSYLGSDEDGNPRS